MSEYLSPSVYVENSAGSNQTIESTSASTGGFVGILPRGILGKAILVTSWIDFVTKFAFGLDTPFMTNSDLVYSVWGFFQNGGTSAYIVRVAGTGAKKATASIMTGETNSATLTAKDEGEWANTMKVVISANADDATKFDVKLYMGSELVESYLGLSNTSTDKTYFVDVLETSSALIGTATGTLVVTEGVTFTGGDDDLDTVSDTSYSNGLKAFDAIEEGDINLVCIPGQTSATIVNALASYANSRNVFAIFDAPRSSTVDTVKTFRKTLSCNHGALYFPWIKVSDPLSKTGKLRECPTAGHIMGVYARIIKERGVWKAPAGVEATVRGAIDVVTTLVKSDLDVLNPLGVNSIIVKPSYGIVVWGARSLSADASFKYVSQIMLNLNVKNSINKGTQWAVFEPNDTRLWTRITTTIQSYLDILWRDGAFFGDTAKQAYRVTCDETLNPEASRKLGRLITEVGYADKDTAEFIIFKVSHSMSN